MVRIDQRKDRSGFLLLHREEIRQVQLRGLELESREGRRPGEYWEDDFPDL